MTIVLFATMSPTIAGQFNRIVDLAVILIIVPYIYSAVAVVKVIADQHAAGARRSPTYKWIALGAVVYCLWAVIGGDPHTVVHAMVALLISVPLYPFFIRSMEAAAQRKRAQPAAQTPLALESAATAGVTEHDTS